MPTHPARHPNSTPTKRSNSSTTSGPGGSAAETGTFRSILLDAPQAEGAVERQEPPDFFPDLNLDQIVDTITAGREQYDLKPFFYAPLASAETVDYRQDVFRDLLENPRLLELVRCFAEKRLRITRINSFKVSWSTLS